MLDDIRTYARLQLQISSPVMASGMTRAEFVALVRKYAIEKHGDKTDVRMHAERTARHVWDSRR